MKTYFAEPTLRNKAVIVLRGFSSWPQHLRGQGSSEEFVKEILRRLPYVLDVLGVGSFLEPPSLTTSQKLLRTLWFMLYGA